MDGFTKYHANSPHSLDAIGRGMMKKLHPLEVRIPDCLCTFSGDQLPKLPARRLKTKDGRTVRGAGRGGQPSVSSTSHSYLSRERLIGRSLDSKKMDIKEGKGFILEKFLGQQAHNFNVKAKSTFSQSSGHSRRTCPPRVQTNHSEEWPGLKRMETGSNAHAVDHKSIGSTIKKDRNKQNHQAESFDSASVGNICRSHSEEHLDSSARSDKPNRKSEVDPSGGKGTHCYVENNCTYNIASTVEASKSGNIESNALESKSEESSLLERSNEREKNARETGQDAGETEVSLSTLSKEISKTNENARDTGQDKGKTEVSLKEISTTNDELGEEILNADSKEPLQTEISNSAETENEVNYRLLGKQEEFEAGDVLPLSGPNVLQVEGLPEEIKNEDVSDLFLSCGTVTACKVLRDADTKLCIGVAYVRLEESSACAMAVSSFNQEPSPFTEFYEDDKAPILIVRHFTISS